MSLEPQNLSSIIIRNPYYVVQNHENEYRLRHKKQLDDKIMNNILKINLVIFFICLLTLVLFFVFDSEIVVFKLQDSTKTYTKVGFSMYNFSVEKNKKLNYWKIFCIKSRCSDTTCPGLDFEAIMKDLDLDCHVFSLYKKLGITVIVGFFAGGIINLITFVSLLLYIKQKLTLETLEIIILFTKFEFILYFFSITIYFAVHFFSGTGFKITTSSFFSSGVVILSIINYCSFRAEVDSYIEKLEKCEYIMERDVKKLCDKAKEILKAEENVIYLNTPITICGDIHGQFHDLIELFKIGGKCPDTNYLFLGDFVDRGYNSVETFLLLLALKVRYPQRVALLRGNHESRQITQVYGFYDECLRKYGSSNVWKHCTEIFDMLTLAAVIDNKIFCVHGGLTPTIMTLSDINSINRFQEIPHDGPMCDLLWSDPEEIDEWESNPRGAGVIFGVKLVDKFLKTNNIVHIVRAHQLIMEGYKSHFDGKLTTIWSAPNYCYRCGNVAAILELDENLEKNFKRFNAAPEDFKEPPLKKPLPEYFL